MGKEGGKEVHIQAITPAAQRLYNVFVSRPFGVLKDEAILFQLGYILRSRGIIDVYPRDAKDLLVFDEKQSEAALKLLPTLDIALSGARVLALVARSAV